MSAFLSILSPNSFRLLTSNRETAADENPTSYYPLLDRVASGEFRNASTDAALYVSFLRAIREEGFLTTPEELASFDLALSIHAAAPRIEAHYHYYENMLEPRMGKRYSPDCAVWLLWAHKQVCQTTGDYREMMLGWERYPKWVPPECHLAVREMGLTELQRTPETPV